MKKRNLLIAAVLAAANLATEAFTQENIRATIKNFESKDVIETDIVRKNYPVIKKFNRSTTVIKLASSPALAQQLEEAIRQDREKAIHAEERKKDGKVYMFYRFASSTYSYTRSADVINIIENIDARRGFGVYTFFVNVVPEDFRFPLIGFVNTAIGSHQGLQAGFVNTTLVDFYGVQTGFVNSTFNDNTGLQAGFVNTTINESNGVQTGFVNTTGMQDGCQIGFVNMVRKATKGAQIGFVNMTGGSVHGSQIGFVNYADTITGAPIGFLSIVKKGGYRAVEYSVNEWYPVNLSFKIGVPKLYTFVQGSYNADFEKQFAIGYGLGSLLSLSKKFYFNPEISSMQPLGINYHSQIQSITANIRYKITPHLQIAAGPSIAHIYAENENNLFKPDYSFVNSTIINHRNQLVVSARAALSINF
jgi:hypothetical protein